MKLHFVFYSKNSLDAEDLKVSVENSDAVCLIDTSTPVSGDFQYGFYLDCKKGAAYGRKRDPSVIVSGAKAITKDEMSTMDVKLTGIYIVTEDEETTCGLYAYYVIGKMIGEFEKGELKKLDKIKENIDEGFWIPVRDHNGELLAYTQTDGSFYLLKDFAGVENNNNFCNDGIFPLYLPDISSLTESGRQKRTTTDAEPKQDKKAKTKGNQGDSKSAGKTMTKESEGYSKEVLAGVDKNDDDDPMDDEEDLDDEDDEGSTVDKTKHVDDLFKSTNPTDIMDLVKIIDPAIKYSGFDPKMIRNKMILSSKNDFVVAKNLIICFSAYAHVGNNVSKLSNKRVDLKISKKVSSALSRMKVVKVDRNKDSLTLPRIAIAFMPMYLMYRKFIAQNLQDQTASKIDVCYKDLAFDGCEAISNLPGYSEFHKEFSMMIYKGSEEIKPDDPVFLSTYQRFKKVTRSGYKSDGDIHTMMSNVIASDGIDQDGAVQEISVMVSNLRASI